MRVSAWRSVLLFPLSVPAAAAAQASACVDTPGSSSEACNELARDSVLLQSQYSMYAGASPPGASAHSGPRAEGAGIVDLEVDHPVAGGSRDSQGIREEWLWGKADDDDWMMELTLDNEWIAGGGWGDTDFDHLSVADKNNFTMVAHHRADEILHEGGDEALRERQAWRQQFATEHKKAVDTLRLHPDLATTGQSPCKRHEGAGDISGLYTFGAPGTALSPLKNVQREDGKFPGVRLVTQRLEYFWGIEYSYSDPVPFVAGLVGLKHPHMDLLLLPANHTPRLFAASRITSTIPRSDMAFWVKGHFQNVYTDHLLPHKDLYDPKAYEMLFLSKAVSPGLNNHSRVNNAREAGKVGWNLVAQGTNEPLWEDDVVFQDNTSLFQDPATQACALAFVGTHHLTQWLVNLKFQPSSFCGIPNIHLGFRNQVRRAIRSSGWAKKVQPALAFCPTLYITGHSLGGAQAQLVAACLQRAPAKGQPGWEDYRYLVWTPDPAQARTLPAIA